MQLQKMVSFRMRKPNHVGKTIRTQRDGIHLGTKANAMAEFPSHTFGKHSQDFVHRPHLQISQIDKRKTNCDTYDNTVTAR